MPDTNDILAAAAALAAPLPDSWRTAPWQPSLVLAGPWAEDNPAVPTDERGPFLAVSCSLDGDAVGIVDSDASAHLAALVATLPDLVLALAAAESEALRHRIEKGRCPACKAAPGWACESNAMVVVGMPGWSVHPLRVGAHDPALRRLLNLPQSIHKALWHRVLVEHGQVERPNLANTVDAIRSAEGKLPVYRPDPLRPPPTARFAGSNSERQSVGDPGHCERCAEVGHVKAHPELGCGDVGCYANHDEPSDPVTSADLVSEMRGRADKGVAASPVTLAYWADVFESEANERV